MLSWEEYIQKGIVRKTEGDLGVISSLIKTSEAGIETISEIDLNEKTCSTIFKNYYDGLREVCEAVALLKGYKIYQHEAIGLFLRIILKEDAFSYKFDRFRIMRNGLAYYGRIIDFDEAKQAIIEIKEIVKALKNKYIKNV